MQPIIFSLQITIMVITNILLFIILYNNKKLIYQQYQFNTSEYKKQSTITFKQSNRATRFIIILLILVNTSPIPIIFGNIVLKQTNTTQAVNLSINLLQDLYTVDPSELLTIYDKYDEHIMEDTQYQIGPNNLPNLIYRHKEFTSTSTEINFMSITSDINVRESSSYIPTDNNLQTTTTLEYPIPNKKYKPAYRVILTYSINVPITNKTATRICFIEFNRQNKITSFMEYDTLPVIQN